MRRTVGGPGVKYYTAFLFEGYTPKQLHCTHKYLGELSTPGVEEIIGYIDRYIHLNRKVPSIAFIKRDYFGPKKNIPVLRPEDNIVLFPELRAVLDKFKKDDYPLNLHVSTKLDTIPSEFAAYALCDNKGNVIRSWRLR